MASTLVFELMSPETTSTSPLGKVVVVGYQRAAFMSGNEVNPLAAGSKITAWA